MPSVIDAPAVRNAVRRHGNGTVDIDLDRILIARAQAGDSAAFAELYEHYHRRLFVVCLRRLADSHEAEDVVQESFARAWRSLPGFAGERRFYPWLSVIASHLCTDILRRRGRAVPVADLQAGEVASAEESGEERVLAQCERAEVASALRRLNERHRRVLALREQHQWSYQEIADAEGIAVSAVETLLWRARRALERSMADAAKIGQLALVVGLGGVATLARRCRRTICRQEGGWSARSVRSASSFGDRSRERLGWYRVIFASWTRRAAVAGAQWTGCPGPRGGQLTTLGAVAVSVAVSVALVGSAAPRSGASSASVSRTPIVAGGDGLPAAGWSSSTSRGAVGSMLRGVAGRGVLVALTGGLGSSAGDDASGGTSAAGGAARGVVGGVGSTTEALLHGLLVLPASWSVPSATLEPGVAPPGAVPATSVPAGSVPGANQETSSGVSAASTDGAEASPWAPAAGSAPAPGSPLASSSTKRASSSSTEIASSASTAVVAGS